MTVIIIIYSCNNTKIIIVDLISINCYFSVLIDPVLKISIINASYSLLLTPLQYTTYYNGRRLNITHERGTHARRVEIELL